MIRILQQLCFGQLSQLHLVTDESTCAIHFVHFPIVLLYYTLVVICVPDCHVTTVISFICLFQYFIILCIIAFFLFIGGILAIVFRTQVSCFSKLWVCLITSFQAVVCQFAWSVICYIIILMCCTTEQFCCYLTCRLVIMWRTLCQAH